MGRLLWVCVLCEDESSARESSVQDESSARNG
jgi:hypothetical protein